MKAFGAAHSDRLLRSIAKHEARAWATKRPGTVPALRAMFNDALEDGLCDIDPFAKLVLDQSKGREDIIVVTREDVDDLAELARLMHGAVFGPEVAALILWGAYTRMRSARATRAWTATRTICGAS